MAEVVLEHVSKSFGHITAVNDLSITISDGGFVVLLGPTGAGKTTTLRLIAGLEKLDGGSIHLNGRDVGSESPAQRDVAVVFQQYSLYPHMTVRENLSFPLKSPAFNLSDAEIINKVNEVARTLQIAHKLDNNATQLSGGEMQRVSIGRALVRDPQLYLMDEPLSSLDAKLRADLRVELKRIHADLGATLLYVTHDQIEAMTMATKIGVLEEGRLAQFGSPREIYGNPHNVYVASRLGIPRINILPSHLFSGDHKGPQIGLRPENIVEGEGVDARVTRTEHLGDQTRLHLDLKGHPVITLIGVHADYATGTTIKIGPRNPLYFDAQGKRVF
ncbi:MAG: ABC transporter ATP-binding protein [Aestuariivita sp.]|nr:ABC transporter ATP-binding protein [Aestuariivita sp.]MCY4201159.1 ABC transporter ATP-binding protein [Aestuariivita sp.]